MRPTATYDNLGNLVWECETHLGHPTYEDDLIEACGSWVCYNLYFPYYDDRYTTDRWECHEHSFQCVLVALTNGDSAKHMSLEGFEEYYGKTEIELFNRVKEKILKEELNEG